MWRVRVSVCVEGEDSVCVGAQCVEGGGWGVSLAHMYYVGECGIIYVYLCICHTTCTHPHATHTLSPHMHTLPDDSISSDYDMSYDEEMEGVPNTDHYESLVSPLPDTGPSIYAHTRTHTHTHTCTQAPTHTHTHTHMYARTPTHRHQELLATTMLWSRTIPESQMTMVSLCVRNSRWR